MTVHPRPQSFAAPSGRVAAEVPGLAYYSAHNVALLDKQPKVIATVEAQALEQMFGYFGAQE